MARSKIVSIDEEVDTPAGDFEDVLKTKETTPLEPGTVEFRYYAPGIGLIGDGGLVFVKHGFKQGYRKLDMLPTQLFSLSYSRRP